MILIAILLVLTYALLLAYTLRALCNGRFEYVLLYAIIFFPIYALFLSFTYQEFESRLLAQIIQYSKEGVIFTAFLIWIFGQSNVLKVRWNISLLDGFFIAFISLTVFFFFLGYGEATVMNRAIYVKNILVIGVFYFFGRNVKIHFSQWNRMFKVIFLITILACGLVVLEKTFGIHFHSFTGYAKYNLDIKGEEPTGLYGLAWTFEAEGGRPRYGSFFAHPLELSSAMLLTGAACAIYLISTQHKNNSYVYLFVLLCALICLLFAYSRASFAAFFMMLAFMAFLLRYYRVLWASAVTFVLIGVYVFFFAHEEIRFFVLDTISFRNSSSLTHLVDWLAAVESIITNPMGIGLAMSGNAGGVEKELIVGGENQFLVYGVQMGVVGMMLYIGMIVIGIRNTWRAFRFSATRKEGIVPFVACCTKFGLLLPLFTANAEVYIYVCLVSWWFIGYSETQYQSTRARINFQSSLKTSLAT